MSPKESLEWYLSNNLNEYLRSIEESTKPIDILRATKLLSRFCTESMDWDTEIYKKCGDIMRIGYMLGRDN
jgi:hypothetical protein